MIRAFSEYVYTTGKNHDPVHGYPNGDVDRILIDGSIMPFRGVMQKVLRGEDILFLQESMRERMAALGRVESAKHEFSREVNALQAQQVADFLTRTRPIDTAQYGGIYMRPSAFAQADAESAALGNWPHAVTDYRLNFPQLTDDGFYPPAPIPSPSFANRTLYKQDILDMFENQSNLTCAFSLARYTSAFGAVQKGNGTHRTYSGSSVIAEEAYDIIYGSGSLQMLAYARRSSGSVSVAASPIRYEQYASNEYNVRLDQSAGVLAKYNEVAMRTTPLPPDSKATPVLAFSMTQYMSRTNDSEHSANYTRYGFCTLGLLSHRANRSGNDVAEWTWGHLIAYGKGVDFFKGKSFYKSPPSGFLDPPASSDLDPLGRYSVVDDFEVWVMPFGYVVELGDHTKWWN